MATLDVSFVPICAEFSDTFQVQQRPETITQFGRSQVTAGASQPILGTIYPTGDNSLQRQEDKQYGRKTLTCVTLYRLRTSSPGAQPDFVFYRGNIYLVSSVNDYSQYGAGFVEATLSSVESIDAPPQ
jgi:hypothetical protein